MNPYDVVKLCSDLIRIDTSATGDGEREAAEYMARELCDIGLEPKLFERTPRRSSVVARLQGTDSSQPALLVQMHLDVVPADAADWSVDPYSGEVKHGHVWGRGAVDMKNMVAMTTAALHDKVAAGWRPARDIVIALLADEELGGGEGAEWLVNDHPDLFDGCSESIGEAGGFSHDIDESHRAYFVQTAEKGLHWLKLVAHGQGGHGSLIHPGNPNFLLAEAIQRLRHFSPAIRLTSSTEALVAAATEWSGEVDADAAFASLGPLGRLFAPTLRNNYSVTQLAAGLQHNVVPSFAEANVDCRYVPGFGDAVLDEIRNVVGDLVTVETVRLGPALETSFTGTVPDAIRVAIEAEDPGSTVLPVCLPIGTDSKHFDRIGIRGFGFVPLQLPKGYDFPSMFHGVDERVPVSSLLTGVRILKAFFDEC